MTNMLQWDWLVFELPFLAALLLAVGSASGLVGDHGDVDVDADIDTDVDLHFEAECDIDHDLELGHDVEHDVSGDAEGEHSVESSTEPSALTKALYFFGVGRVPLSLVLMSLGFIWGFTGFWTHRVLDHMLLPAWLSVWPSLGVAAVSSSIGTRGFTKVLSKLMPTTVSFSTRREDLVGAQGEVVSRVSAQAGLAYVRDQQGNLRQVEVRIRPGQENLPIGAKIRLRRYDAETNHYYVVSDLLHQLSIED